ncbi:uncharacterized protein V1477_009670 [Vespula maculifrons]|uniref:Uncharacterized protein n=1 Tax=Vespula maculifrons TaxID=7453 RepID=A0ABD2CAF1_VESMC
MLYHSYFPHSTISFVLDLDYAFSEDVDGLSPRGATGIFIGRHRSENLPRFYASTTGDIRLRETTTKWGLRPTLTVTSLVVFRTSTRGLRKFSRNAIGASINKEITHVYFLSLLFSTFYTISFVLDFDEALLEDVDGLCPRGAIGIFIGHHKNEN